MAVFLNTKSPKQCVSGFFILDFLKNYMESMMEFNVLLGRMAFSANWGDGKK